MHQAPERRKVLLITYEFPPTGGGGVQRVAKFAQYLPAAGWDPIVVSAAHVPGRPHDESLAADVVGVPVIRTPARSVSEPVSRALALPRRMRDIMRPRRGVAGGAVGGASASTGARQVAGRSMTTRVTATLAVPDHAAYWIGTAVSAAVRAGREHGVEAVLASSPPYSALVAGARAARALGVPFVADMRDAWADNPGVWYPTSLHGRRARALEREAMAAAAVVTVASGTIEEARRFGARRVESLPNGFDAADIIEHVPRPHRGRPLRLAFMGTFYGVTDPAPLLRAMAAADAAGSAGAGAVLEVIGPDAPWVEAVADHLGLAGRVRFLGYRPHREALEMAAAADAGVAIVRDTEGGGAVYPGKLFEYLAARLPVLFVGPGDGVAAQLVHEAGAGVVGVYSDDESVRASLDGLAAALAADPCAYRADPAVVSRFDRRSQAAVLGRLLDEAVRG